MNPTRTGLVYDIKCPTCSVNVVRTDGRSMGSFFHCGQQWMYKEEKTWIHNYLSYDPSVVEASVSMTIDQKITTLNGFSSILGQYDLQVNRMLAAKRLVSESLARLHAARDRAKPVLKGSMEGIHFVANRDAQLKVWIHSLNVHASFDGHIPPGQNVSSCCKYAREHGLTLLPWLEGSTFDVEPTSKNLPELPSAQFGDLSKMDLGEDEEKEV